MIRLSDVPILLAQSDPGQEQLLRGSGVAVGLSLHVLPGKESLRQEIEQCRYAWNTSPVLIVDVAVLAAQALDAETALKMLTQLFPTMRIICTLGDRITVTRNEVDWLTKHGASAVFANANVVRLEETVIPVLRAAIPTPDLVLNVAKVADYLRVLDINADESSEMSRLHQTMRKLEKRNIPVASLIDYVRGPDGFEVKSRSYRLKPYLDCFIASEAVKLLTDFLDCSTEFALMAGLLLQRMDIFHHVTGDHDFKDESLFFRFYAASEKLDQMDLSIALAQSKSAKGFVRADRAYLGRNFPDCFIGHEAVDWLCARYLLSRQEAVTLGQSLLRLHVFRHVTDDHDFLDQHYFYRFS